MTLFAPAFLLGLLAVGIPIWLHRLSSENPNRQAFSSLMFLEPGEPRRVLAKKLQYLLLFALRVAVLVLLALAFAGPAVRGAIQNLVGETARLHLIVMDLSASMGHSERWTRAEALAESVIDDLGTTDLSQLVTVGRVVQVAAEPSLDRTAVRQAIATLEPGFFRIDYGQLMSSVDSLLRGVELPVVVHLITDTQRASLPTRFADLAPRTPLELIIHDVSADGESNWGVDGLGWSAVSGDFVASVRGYAGNDVERTVTLQLNGNEVAEQTIIVAAGDSAQVTFEGLELASGGNRVVARLLPGDDLSVDDERNLVVKRPVPRPVLLVSGNVRQRDALFLTSALSTLAAQAFDVDEITPAEIAGRDLGDYVFVVVGDGGALADEDSAALRSYVESGGALLMALGQRSAGFDEVPVTGHGFEPFSQFGFGEDDYLVVGNMDRTHPALGQVDGMRSSRFYRHVAIETEDTDRVLIWLEQGSPLLIEHLLGEGRVMIFASSLDREWNDLPVQPAFVPFIGQLSAYLAGDHRIAEEARLGGTLSPRAMGLVGGQIFAPDGARALGLAGTGTSDEVLVESIGFYEVVGAGQTELVAVNVDPRESEVTPMEANALARWQDLGSGSGQAAAAGDLGVMETPPTELWPWILALLAVIVCMESWVGNWHLRVRRGMAT